MTIGEYQGNRTAPIGRAYTSTLSFARPANTTAYTSADVIGVADSVTPADAGSAIHTFVGASRAGGRIQITSASITISVTAIPSGMTTFKLHLYDVAPASAILDNAAFSTSTADRLNYRGSIDFTIGAVGAGFLYASATVNQVLQTTTANLFGVLQTGGGYTPTSGANFSVILNATELG